MTIYTIEGTGEECLEGLAAMCTVLARREVDHILVSADVWQKVLAASQSNQSIWQPHPNLPPSFQGYPVKVNQFLPPNLAVPITKEQAERIERSIDKWQWKPHSRH